MELLQGLLPFSTPSNSSKVFALCKLGDLQPPTPNVWGLLIPTKAHDGRLGPELFGSSGDDPTLVSLKVRRDVFDLRMEYGGGSTLVFF